MRKRLHLFAAALLGTLAVVAFGATFTKFTPATGILVGSASSSTTTAATSGNVIGLWSGTCNSSSFLRGDGACAAAGGSTGTTGSFTLNWSDACTTTPTTAVTWTLDDTATVVTWNLAAMSASSCTSDSTSFTSGTDVPANLRPGTTDVTTAMDVRVQDNGVVETTNGCLTITTTGVVLVRRALATIGCQGGWTATGAKSVNGTYATSITYRLN